MRGIVGHIVDHVDGSGLCQCPCDDCTTGLRLCVCLDCRCESAADHAVPDGVELVMVPVSTIPFWKGQWRVSNEA